MNTLLNILLFSTQSPGNGSSTLIMLLLMFVIIYFFMIRPQSKKAKEQRQFKEQLKKGDKVVTIGGIHGKIVDVKENYFLLEIADNVKIKIMRDAISMESTMALNKE